MVERFVRTMVVSSSSDVHAEGGGCHGRAASSSYADQSDDVRERAIVGIV